MLLESVIDGTSLVVPKLNRAVVKGSSQQRKPWMEGDALDPVGLGLELCEHLHVGGDACSKESSGSARFVKDQSYD